MADPHPKYFLLSGDVRSGKTTLLRKVVEEAKRFGLRINGLLSLEHREAGEHTGYNGLEIQSGNVFPLARTAGDPGWEHIGRYFFRPEGLELAARAILDFRNADLTVIDEIGPLELEEKGLWPVLESVFRHRQPAVFVVRSALVPHFRIKIPFSCSEYRNDAENCFTQLISNIRRLIT